METINASEFEAQCLAALDRVCATGERIVILRRGQPVAELGPVAPAKERYPQLDMAGSVTVVGDIVGPVVADADWESNA